MKKILLTFVLLVGIVFGLFAQKLTYQAVIRDNNQQLVVNTDVKATVTIAFTSGDPYQAEVNGSTNIHGLLSIEFGDETLKGRDWTGATIAVKVVNKNDESVVYVNEVPRSVSAVPYALSVDGQSIQNYLTANNYVNTTELDSRHYLTSDSAVITTMQNSISTNANNIDNLILHTAKAAIRDSVAGQIHDSIAKTANSHTHDNIAILNATTATYTNADSTKLDGIAAGAEVNVQADWTQDTTTADDYIKNKPSLAAVAISGSYSDLSGTPTNVSAFTNDANYLTNADLTLLLNAMNAKIDSLAHLVDSLSQLSHGGGDTPTAFTCGTDKVKDVDNNEYNTVQIGSQCWMAQNLRTNVGDGVYPKKNSGTEELDAAEQVTYGRLYTWTAATKGASTNYPENIADTLVHGICPAGWHVPSNAEWDTLTNYVNSVADYRCGGTNNAIANALSFSTGWQSQGGCAAGYRSTTLNKTGFSAVPAGYCFYGYFLDFGLGASFWSATQNDGNYARCRNLTRGGSYVYSNDGSKDGGFSVRCLRD